MKQNNELVQLLHILWRNIAPDYKSRYRMTIWDQFENEIRAAAYTSSLPKFVERISLRLGSGLGRNAEERALAERLLGEMDAKDALKKLREETTLLVLTVRVENEERREAWAKAQEGNE